MSTALLSGEIGFVESVRFVTSAQLQEQRPRWLVAPTRSVRAPGAAPSLRELFPALRPGATA